MRKINIFTLVLIMVVMIFSFVGCSNSSDETYTQEKEDGEEFNEVDSDDDGDEIYITEKESSELETEEEDVQQQSEALEDTEDAKYNDYHQYESLEVLAGENYARDLSHKALTEDISVPKDSYTISNNDFALKSNSYEGEDLEYIFQHDLSDFQDDFALKGDIISKDVKRGGIHNNNIYYVYEGVVYYFKLPNTEVDSYNNAQERMEKVHVYAKKYADENNLDLDNSEAFQEAYQIAHENNPVVRPKIHEDDYLNQSLISINGQAGIDNSEEDNTLTVYYKGTKIKNGMTREEVKNVMGKEGIASEVIEKDFGHMSNEIAYLVEEFKSPSYAFEGEFYNNVVLYFGFNKETDVLDYVGLRLE